MNWRYYLVCILILIMLTCYIILTNPTMNRFVTMPYLVNTGQIPIKQEEPTKKEKEKTTQTSSHLNVTNSDWFVLKEKENDDRRKAITSMCSKLDSVVRQFMEFSLQDIILSERNMIAYCRVPKIASTNWTHFFLRTGKG